MELFGLNLNLKKLREERDQRKLGEAIAKQNIKDIQHFLEKGARRIDYLRYYPNEQGVMVPISRYSDPVLLAQHTGLSKQGMELLARYGLRPDGPQPAPNRGPGLSAR